MDFKIWLTGELNQRNWTRQELARRAGISHTLISLIYSGERSITWDFCASVAGAFGYDPVEVFRIAGLLEEDNHLGNGNK